jgi:hypothetical protein
LRDKLSGVAGLTGKRCSSLVDAVLAVTGFCDIVAGLEEGEYEAVIAGLQKMIRNLDGDR